MNRRMLLGLLLSLSSAGVCAQSAVAPTAGQPRLPGDADSAVAGHVPFHFKDGDSRETRWARQMGQGVARIVAQDHKMANRSFVQYGRPGEQCRISAMKPQCP